MSTIFAFATSTVSSSISVLRISGAESLQALKVLHVERDIKPRFATFAKIYDGNSQLDEVVITYFKAPHSFTGENILEISIHASSFVKTRLIHILGQIPNFRIANAGEFSLRAFKNGKIDLTAAEGILHIISSKTDAEHKFAMKELNGTSKSIYEQMRKSILESSALIQASIDFPEEEGVSSITLESIKTRIDEVIKSAQKIISSPFEKLASGIEIAIYGKPNVGKSSLLNKILGQEYSIVSDIPGTTRDVISKQIVVDGFLVTFNDTAGLRETNEIIEKIGIEKAVRKVEMADIKLHLVDGDVPKIIDNDTIIVCTKCDLFGQKEGGINISSTTGHGIEDLLNEIRQRIADKFSNYCDAETTSNVRTREILLKIIHVLQSVENHIEIEFFAEDLRHVVSLIGQITGVITEDEIFSEIFSKFCIGK